MSDPPRVLDASALLCLFFREPGAERVEALLPQACLSAVNFCEMVTKAVDYGVLADQLLLFVAGLHLDIVALDRHTAELAGLMRVETRKAGLSLGDRCCLALAKTRGGVAVTTDRAWVALDVGVPVELVR